MQRNWYASIASAGKWYEWFLFCLSVVDMFHILFHFEKGNYFADLEQFPCEYMLCCAGNAT